MAVESTSSNPGFDCPVCDKHFQSGASNDAVEQRNVHITEEHPDDAERILGGEYKRTYS